MLLDKIIIDKIQSIIQTAQLVGIDSVIVSKEMVRATNIENTVIIFHGEDIDLPFDAIALNRLPTFASRLELAAAGEKFQIDATVDDNEEFAKSLTMKNKKTKIDYRCANPSTVKAPKQIQDAMCFEISLDAGDINTLGKAALAMGTDLIEISGDKDTAQIKMIDINRDEFKHDITGSAKIITGNKTKETSFSHKYPAKILLALLKKSPGEPFRIGAGGLLNITANGINLFIIPQV